MVYSEFIGKTSTPQTESIPGREAEMIKGRSEAVTFDAGIWAMLRRCLIMGTANGSYYAGNRELTGEFIDTVNQAIAVDPAKVSEEIQYTSDGKAINNSAPIFALVLLSCAESKEAKTAFKTAFMNVVRTGSHFHEWMSYTKQLRGMGRLIRDAGHEWLNQDIQRLTYQMLKYPQRHGMSFRDELRLLKPVYANNDSRTELAGYVVGKRQLNVDIPEAFDDLFCRQAYWYEWLKQNPDQGERAVREGGLTHEMAAPIANMGRDVWQALFEQMPVTATLRNLGSLTEIGVIRADAVKNLDRLESVLCDRKILRKARIHPIDVLKALKTYASGGSMGRSRKTWTVVARVLDILEDALSLSFETQQPTGKVFLHAVDVSGSMSWSPLESVGLTCAEIAATMALVTAKAEKNYSIRGFSTEFIDLGVTARDSFQSACKKTSNHNFGGTDASIAYDWAIWQKQYVDVFCFWTDSESWAGRRHPSQALADYRRKVNPGAKAIYVTLQPNQLSLADPQDAWSYDFGGFDPSIPKAIQMIAEGVI